MNIGNSRMRLIADDLDDTYYMDVVLSAEEIERMRMGEMIDTVLQLANRTYYVGARIQRGYDEEELWKEED